MFIFKGHVQGGGLISYGVDPKALFRQLGFYVQKYSMERNLPTSLSSRPQNLNCSST
jgi:hypothetical protein